MIRYNHEFSDVEFYMFPELRIAGAEDETLYTKTITFQVTEECSLRCTYCYQGCKKPNFMNFDTAKAFIDQLFANRLDPNAAINEFNTRAIIIEFIGGEPFLCIDLIDQICDYFEQKLFENPDCIWVLHHMFSACSNGIAYFEPKVQAFLKKHAGFVDVTITIDGCKELHDKCRVFPDGSPSYDIAIKAALDLLEKGNSSTKITLSPDNICYAAKGVINMLELGFNEIMLNPVYEEGWELYHAKEAYLEYKKIADYIVSHELQDKVYIRIFEPMSYQHRYDKNIPETNRNWCGSTSSMFALDYQGKVYPCIRFMESSLNGEMPGYVVGDIETGIGNTEEYKNKLDALHTLTKEQQSEQKCLDCPIESGCSWCTGYHYQHFGTIAKRAVYICDMHKAAALASKYFYKLCKDKDTYDKINVTWEIAKDIISREEWGNLQWEN